MVQQQKCIPDLLKSHQGASDLLYQVDADLKEANDAMVSGDLQRALTLGVKEWQERLISIVRATDFVAKTAIAMGDLTLAAEVAEYIKSFASFYPQGYLRASQVLRLQGNLADALAECRTGRERTCEEHHPVLEEAERTIQGKPINFIARLPVEVVDKIFGYLNPSFILSNCMAVSKGWRLRLSQCSSLWRSIEVYAQQGIWRGMNGSKSVLLVSQHIRQFKVTNADTFWLMCFFHFMAERPFVNLKSLSIHGEVCNGTSTLRLGASLHFLPPSLTTLKIDYVSDPSLTLRKILSTLPNLVTLNYNNTNTVEEAFEDPLPLSHGLKALSLRTVSILKFRSMEIILQAFPNLIGLEISECEDSNLLLTTQYCKQLRYLSFNARMSIISFLDNVLETDSVALSKLVVEVSDMLVLQEFIKHHHKTLEEVHIHNYGYNTLWSQSADHFGAQLDKLRILRFYGRMMTHAEISFAESIVSGCSVALEELRLEYQGCDMTRVFRQITFLPGLKNLILSFSSDSIGLDEYTDSMQVEGGMCPLRSITLEEFSATREQLTWIATIPTLEHISIVNPTYVRAYDLSYFFKRLQSSPVKSVTLDSKKTIRKVVLNAIGTMQNLVVLNIRGALGVREYDLVQNIVKIFKQKLPTVEFKF